MRTALIDGDVLVYSSGFASDGAAKRRLLDELHGDKEAYDKHVAEHGKPYEPVNFCLNGLNTQLNSIVRAAEADDYKVVMSHPVNYREAFYPDYKMNRDITHKPHWENEIKDFLFERHDAIYSSIGDEADDAMGIMQMEAMASGQETIICTIDKDLDMIPGLHYNFSKTRRDNGIYTMEDPEGLRLFYAQVLSGDSSDNIPGMFQRLGIKCDAKWKIPLEGMNDPMEMYDYVMKVYENDLDHVHLMAKLLWIKRDEKWWEPPITIRRKKVRYA